MRVLRDNIVVHTGKIDTLKRFKDDVSEVKAGFECGMTLANFSDMKPGDIMEAFVTERVAPEVIQPKRGMPTIGVLTLEFSLPDAHSLKDKRHTVKSLKDRLRSRFNVAVAEIDLSGPLAAFADFRRHRFLRSCPRRASAAVRGARRGFLARRRAGGYDGGVDRITLAAFGGPDCLLDSLSVVGS